MLSPALPKGQTQTAPCRENSSSEIPGQALSAREGVSCPAYPWLFPGSHEQTPVCSFLFPKNLGTNVGMLTHLLNRYGPNPRPWHPTFPALPGMAGGIQAPVSSVPSTGGKSIPVVLQDASRTPWLPCRPQAFQGFRGGGSTGLGLWGVPGWDLGAQGKAQHRTR